MGGSNSVCGDLTVGQRKPPQHVEGPLAGMKASLFVEPEIAAFIPSRTQPTPLRQLPYPLWEACAELIIDGYEHLVDREAAQLLHVQGGSDLVGNEEAGECV